MDIITIGYIALAVVVFLILREVLTWYWKQNKIVKLLEQIEKNTRVTEIEPDESVQNSTPENQPTGSVWRNGKWGNK